jgi:hypothetical protein
MHCNSNIFNKIFAGRISLEIVYCLSEDGSDTSFISFLN